MEGAPSLAELAGMAVLLLIGSMLILNAWRLLKRYARSHWEGWPEAGPWPLLWVGVNAVGGGGLLSWLWLQLEHISARMGIAAVVLVLFLASEVRPNRVRRRACRWAHK
jgi:hypothetical protein